MKIWTTQTGAYEVKVHASQKDAVGEIVSFLNGCGAETPATPETWKEVLAELNRDMDESGEAHYLAEMKEHALPNPKLVIEVNGDVVHELHTDSTLLDGMEVAVITSGLDVDSDADEVMEIQVGPLAPGEYVGGLMTVNQARTWDAGNAYEAIEAKANRHGMKP